MRVEIITLRFDSVMERFDDTALKEFIVDKEVLSIREHFFTKNGTPFIFLVVTYRLINRLIDVLTLLFFCMKKKI